MFFMNGLDLIENFYRPDSVKDVKAFHVYSDSSLSLMLLKIDLKSLHPPTAISTDTETS